MPSGKSKRIYEYLQSYGFPIEIGTGAQTSFNRNCQSFSKEHWIDAACVGDSGAGFKTGDYVIAKTKKGNYKGRVTTRKRGFFDISTSNGMIGGISWKKCKVIYKDDGYNYSYHKSK